MKRIIIFLGFIFLCQLEGLTQSKVDDLKTQKVMVIGHAHMDPVYRWRWNEIERREVYKTFSDVLNVMDEYPEVRFAQSSLLYYLTIQKKFPKLFDKVKQSIADGRWSVVGGQWVETDESMPSGESLIRQFLISQDYYSKNLGISNIDIAWSPDAFTGHVGTLPKIYSGCGINTYVFSRAAPEGKKVFWWESNDGSRLMAYKIPDHYNPNFGRMPSYIKDWVETSEYDLPMVTVGKGDHGGGPGESDFVAMQRLSENAGLDFEFISPEDYFDDLRNKEISWPVQKSEFGIQPNGDQWLGCYTSQAKIKKLNRYYENKLIAAEKFMTIGTMHKGKPFFPREDFKDAWRILLFNNFHDVIPGTLTGLGAQDVYADYEKLDDIVSMQLNAGLENIGNRINSEMEGIPLVVYNPLSWAVSQQVYADLTFVRKLEAFSLIDSNGKEIPYMIVEQSKNGLSARVLLAADNVPALGYKVFEVVERSPQTMESDLKVNGNQAQNKHYIVTWDDQGISSIYSKDLQKEVLERNGNMLQLLEDNGSAWSLKLTGKEYDLESLKGPAVVEQSPLKVVIQWEDYYQTSKLTRYLILKANSSQIDFEMDIDWHSHNKVLRVVFPTNVKDGLAFYDQPYGYAQREETGRDFPAQKWIDCSNDDWGVSLLNDGKYGFTIVDGKLSMSVVRGARGMDPRMDEGTHSFKYSLIPHRGDWKNADTPLKAWELNQPLIAKQENHHRGEISGWMLADQSFPREKSFFGIDSDHAIISVIKTAQDAYNPNPLIMRIVETEGRDENITVRLPYPARFIRECNHLEEEIEERSSIKEEGDKFAFKIGHDQIRTFKVYF
jgi:alpha-mannosidase